MTDAELDDILATGDSGDIPELVAELRRVRAAFGYLRGRWIEVTHLIQGTGCSCCVALRQVDLEVRTAFPMPGCGPPAEKGDRCTCADCERRVEAFVRHGDRPLTPYCMEHAKEMVNLLAAVGQDAQVEPSK